MARQMFFFDRELGMKLIPGIKVRKQHEGGGYLVSSNSGGFRDDEFLVERQSGTRRVLLYGDSFTFGSGVAKDERFGELIQGSIPNTEVYNLGIAGSGIDQQFLAHEFAGSRLDHDMIVIAPWVQDATRNLQQYRLWNRKAGSNDESGLIWMPKPYFEIDTSGELVLRHYPVPPPVPYTGLDDFKSDKTGQGRRLDALRWRLRKYHPKAKGVIQRLTRYQPAQLYDSADNPGWILTRAILERWVEEADAPVLICPIPMYQHIEGGSSAREVTARFAELHQPDDGVHVFDALSALKRYSRRERRAMRFTSDIHFNATGHRAFADAIVDEVARVLDTAGVPSVSAVP
jgi:lysophospholipase L1-like esterase